MQASIHPAKRIFKSGTSSPKASTRRRLIPIFGGVKHSGKHNADLRRTESTIISILHKLFAFASQNGKLDLKKLALALLIALCKLMPYIQTHPIVFFTGHPLRQVLYYLKTFGCLMCWLIELSQCEICYLP